MGARVEICGVDTSKLPSLKPKELVELMKQVKNGDEGARQKFIYGNYRLVLSITHRFSPKSMNADDIFQVGIIGLIKAIDNFDTSLNVKFSTYAVPMIIGEIKRFLRDDTSLRVSRGLRDVAYQALQAREKLSVKLDREPLIEEIAEEIGQPLNEVRIALDAVMEPVSLFDSVYSNSGDKIAVTDYVSDPKSEGDSLLNNLCLKNALKKLNSREKLIISKRYFEGKTQMEVSEEVGISQAQVSRLEKNALKYIEKNI